MIILPSGIAVIEGDTHLSKWIEEQGRLNVDGLSNDAADRFIKPGDVVVDAGASLGDSTFAFIKAAGETGKVYAFEPNPKTFEALKHNCPGAVLMMSALGAKRSKMQLHPEQNIGASWLDIESSGGVEVLPLDELKLDRLAFFKIDVEGMEPLVLDGALETIKRCKPAIMLEVNHGTLQRVGFVVQDIISRAEALNYTFELVNAQYGLDISQTDVYLLPK